MSAPTYVVGMPSSPAERQARTSKRRVGSFDAKVLIIAFMMLLFVLCVVGVSWKSRRSGGTRRVELRRLRSSQEWVDSLLKQSLSSLNVVDQEVQEHSRLVGMSNTTGEVLGVNLFHDVLTSFSVAVEDTVGKANEKFKQQVLQTQYGNPVKTAYGGNREAGGGVAREDLEAVLRRQRQAEQALEKRDINPVNYQPNQQQPQQQRAAQADDYDNDFATVPISEFPGPAYSPPPDPLDEIVDAQQRNVKRREAVVEAFVHTWNGYKRFAYGYDELKPRSKTGKNWNDQPGTNNGLGLTILDGMTTMAVMGLDLELRDALHFVKTQLHFDVDVDASVFEYTIRGLGSLLSIYELTGEQHPWILDKAEQLGRILLRAFNTSTGIPHTSINLKHKRHASSQWSGGNAALSEIGTIQLEFRTLSFHTKNPVYDQKVTHLMQIIESRLPADALPPVYLGARTLRWATDHISFGALGDSYFEYIIKQYMLTGKTETKYADLMKRTLVGMSKLLFSSQPSKMLYIAEYRAREFSHKMDHLACFIGGTVATSSQEIEDLTVDEREQLLRVAAELTETCVKMYTRQATGISPEYVQFPQQQDFINGPGYYILRPEAMESLFYMWRYTRQQKWRDYGWNIFRAINRYCRVESGGFVGIREVNIKDPPRDNLQQSFWLAETMKYMYLLFAEDSAIDLQLWVFNTEAHPFRRRTRDPLDVWREYEAAHGSVPWYPPNLPGVTPVETTRMREARLSGRANLVQGFDPLGEEMEESMADDEGLPFDESSGMRGILRKAGTFEVLLPGRVAPPGLAPNGRQQQNRHQLPIHG